jgi:hypothetical protein
MPDTIEGCDPIVTATDVFMWAFDLIVNGDDLRRDPLNVRKAT